MRPLQRGHVRQRAHDGIRDQRELACAQGSQLLQRATWGIVVFSS